MTTTRTWPRGLYHTLVRWVGVLQGALWDRRVRPKEGQRGLDIGCGPAKRWGFVGADIQVCRGVDVVCNLDGAVLPFRSGSFDIVYASHILEHIGNLDQLLNETARVLKAGAVLQVAVPYAGSMRAFQDPTHRRFFTHKTMEYFVREGCRVGGWYTSKPFRRILRRHLVFGRGPLALLMAALVNLDFRLLDLYEATFLRAIPAKDVHIELEK